MWTQAALSFTLVATLKGNQAKLSVVIVLMTWEPLLTIAFAVSKELASNNFTSGVINLIVVFRKCEVEVIPADFNFVSSDDQPDISPLILGRCPFAVSQS